MSAVAGHPGQRDELALEAVGVPAVRPHLHAWTLIVFCTAAIAGLLRRAGSFHAATIELDESLYIVMARRWLEGDLPYVAVYDLHPVGLPTLLAAAMWLLDDGLLAARLTALLAVAGTCGALFLIAARFVGRRSVGGIAALLYGIYMLRAEALVPNTEHYNNLLITLAAALLFGQVERVRTGHDVQRTRALLAAFLLGVGLQIKYVVAPEAAGFCLAFLLYWWRHGGETRRVVGLAAGLLLAGLAPTLTAIAYFWSNDALQPFLDANIGSNIAYVGHVLPLNETLLTILYGLKPFAVLVAGAGAALALSSCVPSLAAPTTRRVLYACAFWLALSAANVAMPLKFFWHYFYALLPPLCLMAAILVISISGLTWRLTVPARVLAVLLLAAIPLRAIAREAAIPTGELPRATELATSCIREHPASRPGLYVFNWDPILYETTHTPPPTRYVLPIELAIYSDSAGVDATAEIARILAGRPGHIVVASPSPLAFGPAAMALVEQAVVDYELVCSIPFRVRGMQTAQAMVYRLP